MFSSIFSGLADGNSGEQLVIDPAVFQILSQNFDQAQILAQLKQKIGLQDILPQSDTYKDLMRYLKMLLCYPSTEKAQFHREANRLGNFDIEKETSNFKKSVHHANELVNQIKNCECCGLIKQYEELKICQNSFKDVASIGISTYMFYTTMINLSYLLTISLLIFGLFTLGSNIRTALVWNSKGKHQDFSSYLIISLGSKIYLAIQETADQNLLISQVWLGLVMVVFFMFAYIFMERIQVTEVRNVQMLNKSASDFTAIVMGVPLDLKKEQIQTEIHRIFSESVGGQLNVESNHEINQKPMIAKINVGIPNDHKAIQSNKVFEEKTKMIIKEEKKFRQKIVSFIMELTSGLEFKTPFEVRKNIEAQFIEFRNRTKKEVDNEFVSNIMKLGSRMSSKDNKQLIKKVNLQTGTKSKKEIQIELKKRDQTSQSIKTDVFVTFESRKVKQKLLSLMENTIFDKFLKYLTLDLYQKKVAINLNGQMYKVRIQQASQPQDVIWANIGNLSVKKGTKAQELFFRKCVTFLITFIILGVSFVTIYGLSKVQIHNQDNRYISFLISLCLSIFNFIILYTLRVLTFYELSVTQTDYQSSLGVKTIFAQLINMIVIPILVNRFLKNKDYLYQKSGLAEDVFLLGITNSFLAPILKIFDSYYFYVKYFTVWYNQKPKIKFYLSQKQLNRIYELVQFENGIEYVYIITVYLFTMFFMSLQPIIIVFALVGYAINYWAQKYCLFHRCKRPVPGTRILYDTMVQFIYAGGLFYSLGSLTFVNLIPKDVFQNKINPALIANLIAVGISVFSLFVPFSFLYQLIFGNSENDFYQDDQLFSQDRVFLLSEYDRTNPATRDAAVFEYIEFVNQKKKEIKNKTKAEKAQFIEIFNRQARVACIQRQNYFNPYNIMNLGQQNSIPILAISPGALSNFLFTNMKKVFKLDLNRQMQEPHHFPDHEDLDAGEIILKFAKATQNQQSFFFQRESQTKFQFEERLFGLNQN